MFIFPIHVFDYLNYLLSFLSFFLIQHTSWRKSLIICYHFILFFNTAYRLAQKLTAMSLPFFAHLGGSYYVESASLSLIPIGASQLARVWNHAFSDVTLTEYISYSILICGPLCILFLSSGWLVQLCCILPFYDFSANCGGFTLLQKKKWITFMNRLWRLSCTSFRVMWPPLTLVWRLLFGKF